MPIYTYECDNCGQRFDAKQSFAEQSLTICPNCAGKIHRVIQPVGVVFKGSGFYINDSRSKQNLATSGVKKDDGKSGADGKGNNKADAPAASTDNGAKAPSENGSNGSNGNTTKSDTSTKPAAETIKSVSSESK